MTSSFTRPNDTSTGGAGGGGPGGYSGGSGRVSIPIPPQARPFPWPLPYSATQGGTGSMPGGKTISVPKTPWYQPYQPYWPYAVPDQWYRGLPTNPLRM